MRLALFLRRPFFRTDFSAFRTKPIYRQKKHGMIKNWEDERRMRTT